MDTDWLDVLLHLNSVLQDWALTLVDSVWFYVGVFSFSLIDAIFPVVPSESVLIAGASAIAHTSAWWLPVLFLAGATGAWCGDQLAYWFGRKFDVRKHRMFQGERGQRTLMWAERRLEKSGTTFIIAARFVPMGRLAVNLTAGALRYPYPRFRGVSAIAAGIWALWSIGLGTLAGEAFSHNLLLSIVIGVTGGVLVGLLVDRILGWFGLTSPDLPDLAQEIDEGIKTGQIEVRPPLRERVSEFRSSHQMDDAGVLGPEDLSVTGHADDATATAGGAASLQESDGR